MRIDRIDHVQVATPSLGTAREAFARLGLTLTPEARSPSTGVANSAFFVGEGEAEFYVELVALAGEDEGADSEAGARVRRHLAAGGGLRRVLFHVEDLPGAVSELAGKGLSLNPYDSFAGDGRRIATAAGLGAEARLGFEAALVTYPETPLGRRERHAAAGLFGHRFPLKRLDHLAALAPDVEAATRAWTELLGVPVHGEVRGPGMIIRQLRFGDAILELLGPDGPGSRMAGRPAGLASMCAFEVESLGECVALARERGFSPSEPAKGILPGTRTATIAGAELGGLALQLLEYV